MNLKMNESENLEQFIWRLGRAKDSGEIDLNWEEIADVINKEIGQEDMPYGSSAFRKPYQQAKRFFDSGVFSKMTDEEFLDEIKEQQRELAKQRVKIRDERNELNRLIRGEARKESYREQIIRTISEHSGEPLDYDKNKKFTGALGDDNDLIVTLTDLHTGIDISNYFNTFNKDVLKERMTKYLDKIFEVQTRHRSENVYVVIGEAISGLIHTPIRIESNQTVIEQFLTAVTYITSFLLELSYRFNEVHVYVTPGNHSRVIADKNEGLKGENFDNLIIPFLDAKLQNFKNITCHKNNIDESIAIFNVRGNKIYSAHGDKDSPNTVVQKFSMMFEKPDLIILGHRHTNAMSTVYDTKVLTAGCLSGSDAYCMDKRLQNKPEQIIAVVNGSDCLDCFYDVKF